MRNAHFAALSPLLAFSDLVLPPMQLRLGQDTCDRLVNSFRMVVKAADMEGRTVIGASDYVYEAMVEGLAAMRRLRQSRLVHLGTDIRGDFGAIEAVKTWSRALELCALATECDRHLAIWHGVLPSCLRYRNDTQEVGLRQSILDLARSALTEKQRQGWEGIPSASDEENAAIIGVLLDASLGEDSLALPVVGSFGPFCMEDVTATLHSRGLNDTLAAAVAFTMRDYIDNHGLLDSEAPESWGLLNASLAEHRRRAVAYASEQRAMR